MRGGQVGRMLSFIVVLCAGMILLWAAMRFYRDRVADLPSTGPAGAIVIVTMMLGITLLVLMGMGSMLRRD